MTRKFTFIIPTIWLSDKINCLLQELSKSELVSEIILINNSVEKTKNYDVVSNKKIKHIKNKTNLYVNPSWNLGVETSSNEDIVLCNDDLCVNNIDRILKEILKNNFDLIGLNYSEINKNDEIKIKNKLGGMTKGFGCFLYIKKSKYIKIPNEIKIWYGDKIQYDNLSNKGEISFNGIDIELSKSVLGTKNLFEILENDKKIYNTRFGI